MPTGTFQCPHPCGKSLPTQASTGGLQHYLVVLVWSPVGSLLLSSGSWCRRILVVHSKTGISVSPSPLEVLSIIKPHWLSRPDSLGIPNPFVGSSAREA